MDQSTFDRIARLLGGATTRRQGIAAAIGAAFGLTTAATGDSGAASKRKHAPGGPAAAGPCGDSRAANSCKRNKDCCTNICNIRRSRHTKDQTGRCRCIERARPCSEDRNCCSGLRCYGGLCLAAPPKPSGCTTSAECPSAPSCNQVSCVNGVCGYVADPDDSTCPGGQCKAGACVPCTTDAGCAGNTRKKTCDTATNSCVECTADANCSGNSTKKTCDTDSNSCVECTADANCSGNSTRKTCDTSINSCVQCTADANCSGETYNKVCNTDSNACVQCTAVGDCSPGDCLTATACTANACVTAPDADDAICSTGQCKSGSCVKCTTDVGCASEATDKICKTTDNTCVQCMKDADCDVSTPACKTADNTCVGCANLTYPYKWTGSPLHTPAGIAIDPTWTGKEIWVSNFAYQSAANDAKIGYMKSDGTGLQMGASCNCGGASCQGLTLTTDRVPICAMSTATNGKITPWDPDTLAAQTPLVDYNDANFKQVYGIYTDGSSTSGTLWISTTVGSGNSAVWRFKIGTDTNPTKVFSGLGDYARAIVKGPGGYLYVAVEDSKKVVVLDPNVTGTLPSTSKVATLDLSTPNLKPFGIAFDGNTMFINDRANKKVSRYTIALDNSNVPQFTKVCDYSHTISDSFFFVFDPATNLIWTPSWGATRAADAVNSINIG